MKILRTDVTPYLAAPKQATVAPPEITRRRFLGALGGLGTAAIVRATALAQPATPEVHSETPKETKRTRQWAMVIDLRKCEGCVTRDAPPSCVEACNAEHFVPSGQEWIKVFEMEGAGGHTYFMPRPCMQCENAPCLNVCPVGATYRNEEGVILIDHERCIGCRMCMAACPYDARSFNWEQPDNPPGATFANYSPEYPVPHRRGTVEKCMLCAHRTAAGRLPACAEACPMYAIYLGDLMEDIATNGQEVVKLSLFLAEHSAFRLKEELGTRPRVWYIPGHGEEYGHDVNEHRPSSPARTWQEQEAASATFGKGGN